MDLDFTRNVSEEKNQIYSLPDELYNINKIDKEIIKGLPLFLQEALHKAYLQRLRIHGQENFKPNDAEYKIFLSYYDFLDSLPLGSWTQELLENLLCYIQHYQPDTPFDNICGIDNNLVPKSHHDYYIPLRIKCEQYMKADAMFKSIHLKHIEIYLIEVNKILHPKNGAKLSYEVLGNAELIKLVYASEANELRNLFVRYFQVPNSNAFKENAVPLFILEQEAQKNETVKKILMSSAEKGIDFNVFEKHMMNIQRLVRAKQRKKEESHRIPECFTQFNFSSTANPAEVSFYIPRACSIELSQRIVSVAKKIKFFDYIRHETQETALQAIFDTALYGRKTLQTFFLPFKPAALKDCDIKAGDANVICFGADYGFIDPNSGGDIEFILQLSKMNFDRDKFFHCAFFKQCDFGFEFIKNRVVSVNDKNEIVFTHTMSRPRAEGIFMDIKYQAKHSADNTTKSYTFRSGLPNYQLISYDIQNIELYLILNFFRFLDKVIPVSGYQNEDLKAKIYQDIENMNDEQLSVFLESIGRNLSDTMEFNFFGAHQIDFDSLFGLKCKNSGEKLEIAALITELNNANLTALSKAKNTFPSIFKSYRFLDYLLGKVNKTASIKALTTLRAICKTPGWYPTMQNKQREKNEEIFYDSRPLKKQKFHQDKVNNLKRSLDARSDSYPEGKEYKRRKLSDKKINDIS